MKYKNVFNKIFIILLCILFMFCTGCWDQVEINDRAFIIGIGIDLDKEQNLVKASFSVPNLPVITGQSGTGEKRYLKETSGSTFFEARKNFGDISEFRINFDHVKVIILGEEFISSPTHIKRLLDYFERSSEFSQSLMIVSTYGFAKDILSTKSNLPDAISIEISQILNNTSSEKIKISRMNLGEFTTSMLNSNGSGTLPIIVYRNDGIIIDGLCILKDYKSKYIISSKQMVPFGWIQGDGKGSIANFEYEDMILQYEISENIKDIDFKKQGNQLDINIKLTMEGDIKEYIIDDNHIISESNKIKKVEEKIKDSIEEQSNEIIRIIQKEVGVDVFGISDTLKIKEGKMWKEIKDNWNEYFSSANIYVTVNPSVRRIGMSE